MSEGWMRNLRWMGMVAVIGTAVTCLGQQPASKEASSTPAATTQEQDDRTFVLSFVVKELDEDGKVVNSRRFDTRTGLATGRDGSSIRTGAKVPFSTGNSGQFPQFTYNDVGVSFDVNHVRAVNGNHLAMQVTADVSSLGPVKEGNPPTIRQNRWMGGVQVPIGEHKVIFSSDDLASKRTMQIELTATRVN